jgi:hypothetical protein
LAVAYVAIGLLVATIGFSIGLDGDLFRVIGAILMLGFGILLFSQPLQDRLATAASPLGAGAQTIIERLSPGRMAWAVYIWTAARRCLDESPNCKQSKRRAVPTHGEAPDHTTPRARCAEAMRGR